MHLLVDLLLEAEIFPHIGYVMFDLGVCFRLAVEPIVGVDVISKDAILGRIENGHFV